MLALAMAGGTMYVLNRQWPEHPIQFMDFLPLWAIMLVAIHLDMAIRGRMRRRRCRVMGMDKPDETKSKDLLAAAPRVVNVGLEMFAINVAAHGARVVHVQWSPPAGGDSRLAGLLDKLRR